MKTHNLLSIALIFLLGTLHSQVAVDHSTGIANVSVPLYTLSGLSMDFEIGLGYQAAGIAVADPGGDVGLGWELVGLGRIDRQTHGFHDERWPSEEDGNAGYLWCSHFFQNQDGTFDLSEEWIDKVGMGEYDFQPDKFVVNAPGLEGSFYFTPGSDQPIGSDVVVDSEIIYVPHREYHTEFTIEDGTITSFIVTNELGTRYYFDATQILKTSSHCQGNQMGIQDATEQEYVSSWHLTRIEDFNGNLEIEAQYTNAEEVEIAVQQQFHTSPTGQIISVAPNGVSLSPYCPGANVLAHCFTTLTYSQVRMTTLNTRDASLSFDYSTPRFDFPGHTLLSQVTLLWNGNPHSSYQLEYEEIYDPAVCLDQECRRPVLSKLVSQNSNYSPVGNPITFEYFEGGLPKRSSIDIDHWGFYNYDQNRGHNESLVPLTVFEDYSTFWLSSRSAHLESTRIGTLRKVNNPLGGSTTLEYELHDYAEHLDSSPLYKEATHVKVADISANYSLDDPNETVWSDPFVLEQSGSFRFYTDIFPFANYDNGLPTAQIINMDDNSVAFEFSPGTIELYISANRYPDVWQDITLEAGAYQLKCQSQGWTSPIPDYMVRAELFEISVPDQNPVDQKLSGGLRIKSVTYDDGDIDSSNDIKQAYSYSEDGMSTGIKLSSSIYSKHTTNHLDYNTTAAFYVFGDGCPDPCVFDYIDLYECEYTSLLSTSASESITHHGSPILYESVKVTELDGEVSKGYTKYLFSRGDIDQDLEVPLIPETPGIFTIGNPLKTSVYSSENVLLSEMEYEYDLVELPGLPTTMGLVVESIGLEGDIYIDIDHAEQFMEQDQNNAALGSAIQSLPTLAFQGPIAAAGHLVITGVTHLINNRIQNNNEAEITIDDQSYNIYLHQQYLIDPQALVLSKVYRRQYDQLEPSRYTEDITAFTYDEGSTAYPRMVATSRTGLADKQFQTYTYVDDLDLSEGVGPEVNALLELQNRNASKVILETVNSLGSDLPSSLLSAGSSSGFNIDDLGNVVLNSQYSLYSPSDATFDSHNSIEVTEVLNRSNHFESVREITAHDSWGTPIEWNAPFGSSEALLTHPINGQILAHAFPASVADLAYTSFEDEYLGGWNYILGGQSEESILHKGLSLADAKTGMSAFTLTNSQITKSIDPGEFVVSFWSKGLPELILVGSGIIQLTVEDPADDLGWVYREYMVQKEDVGQTTLFIGSNEACVIDELRFFPKNAFLKTWTYDAIGRLRTTTDQNGRTTQLLYSDDGDLEWTLNDNWEIEGRTMISTRDTQEENSRHQIERIYGKQSNLSIADFTAASQSIEDGTIHDMSFFDGMGRLVQHQVAKATTWNRNVIRHFEFDALGRQSKSWEPFSTVNSGQQFIPDPTSTIESFYQGTSWVVETDFPFFRYQFEESPLDRMYEIGAPGEAWQPGQHSARITYSVNDEGEVLRWSAGEESLSAGGILPDYYSESTLTKITRQNEDGKTTEFFVDELGQLVLKRKRVWSYHTPQYSYTADYSDGQDPQSAYPEPAEQGYLNQDTYYLYDQRGLMIAEIGPQGIEMLAQLGNFFISTAGGVNSAVFDKNVFFNSHDERGRVVESKSPDQARRSFIYNLLDQLVMFQNANLVGDADKNWQVVVYDVQGRSVLGGFTSTDEGRESLQEIWSSQTDNLWEHREDEAPFGYSENGPFEIEKAHAVLFFDERGESDSGNVYEAQEVLSTRTRGELLVRWSEIQDDSGEHLVTSFYLNSQGRICEAVEQLLLQGVDRFHYTYNFEGAVTSVQREQIVENDPLIIENSVEYNLLGQPTIIRQRTGSDPEIILAKYVYNELGQLVKEHLHISENDNSGMQVIDYRYNPRGWLLKINNSNLVDDGDNMEDYDVFGEELIYTQEDQLQPWGGSPYSSSNAIHTEPFYSGLVSAVKWNTKSPDEAPGLLREKTYAYRYDDLGRMTAAAFAMENSSLGSNEYGQFSSSKNVFLESVQYDLNDNIRRVRRNKPNYNWSAPELMDDVQINFSSETNQGSQMTDLATYPEDMNYAQFVDSGIDMDRSFDTAGYLQEDHNNDLSYGYNKFGLVSSITHSEYPESPIQFVHDAGGRLLFTQIADTVRYFMNGVEYIDQGQGLEFVAAGTKVGAVRAKEDFEANATEYIYDYFIKDHLGNVRVIITEGNSIQVTEQVTMEVVNAALEESQFENVEESRSPTPLNYPDASLTNQKVAELSSGSSLVGPGKLIRVRRGDVVDVSAESWYQGSSFDNPMTSIGDMLAAIATGMLTQGGGIVPNGEAGTLDLLDPNSAVSGGIATFLNTELGSTDWGQPQAYLVYLTFTEDLRLMPHLSGTVGLGEEGAIELLEAPEVLINNDGYFYAFVTNYSEQTVAFDNFTLIHQQGKIRGEYDYYPYGLLWYNPTENEEYDQAYQSKSWMHGTWGDQGIDLYDFHSRLHDPVLASWQVPDPMNQFSSPYITMASNPVSFVDPDGMFSFPIGSWFRRLFGRSTSNGQKLVGQYQGTFSFGGFLGNIALGTSSGIASVMAESQRVVLENADRLAAEAVEMPGYSNQLYRIQYNVGSLFFPTWMDYSEQAFVQNQVTVSTITGGDGSFTLTSFELAQGVSLRIENNYRGAPGNPTLHIDVLPSRLRSGSYHTETQTEAYLYNSDGDRIESTYPKQTDFKSNRSTMGSATRKSHFQLPSYTSFEWADSYTMQVKTFASLFEGSNFIPTNTNSVSSRFRIVPFPPINAPRR